MSFSFVFGRWGSTLLSKEVGLEGTSVTVSVDNPLHKMVHTYQITLAFSASEAI